MWKFKNILKKKTYCVMINFIHQFETMEYLDI